MSQVIISVTQQDIDEGVKKDCHACAISRAINRHLAPNHAAEVAGTNQQLAITYGKRRVPQAIWWMYHVSDVMIPWINAWDKGEPVQPWRFSLDIPERLLKAQS